MGNIVLFVVSWSRAATPSVDPSGGQWSTPQRSCSRRSCRTSGRSAAPRAVGAIDGRKYLDHRVNGSSAWFSLFSPCLPDDFSTKVKEPTKTPADRPIVFVTDRARRARRAPSSNEGEEDRAEGGPTTQLLVGDGVGGEAPERTGTAERGLPATSRMTGLGN